MRACARVYIWGWCRMMIYPYGTRWLDQNTNTWTFHVNLKQHEAEERAQDAVALGHKQVEVFKLQTDDGYTERRVLRVWGE